MDTAGILDKELDHHRGPLSCGWVHLHRHAAAVTKGANTALAGPILLVVGQMLGDMSCNNLLDKKMQAASANPTAHHDASYFPAGSTPAQLAAKSGHTQLSAHLHAVCAGTAARPAAQPYLERAGLLDAALQDYTDKLGAALGAMPAHPCHFRISSRMPSRATSRRQDGHDKVDALLPALLKPAILSAQAHALCRSAVQALGDPCLQDSWITAGPVSATPAAKPSAVREKQQQLPVTPRLAALRLWLTDSRLRGWEGEGSQGTQLVATVPYCRPLACLTQVTTAELPARW
jgi:hypothetical protein